MRITQPVNKLVPLASLLRLKGRQPTKAQLKVWVLETPVTFTVTRDGLDHALVIGRQAMTDLASAPWFLHWLLSPQSFPWINAAVIHDHGYAGLAKTRAEADRWWREAVLADGGTRLQAWVTWAGLRVGGFLAWRSNRRNLRRFGSMWRYLH